MLDSNDALGLVAFLVDDSMMNATVWVAIGGILGTLIASVFAQLYGAYRENVRWARELDNRQEQWRREDSLRWLQDRQQAYARLVAAFHDWDAELISALTTRKMDARLNERTELETDEIDRRARAAYEVLAIVDFMAPEKVRSLARSAVSLRNDFRILRLTAQNIDVTDLDKRFSQLREKTIELHEAMRGDLKLATAEFSAKRAGIPPASSDPS